MEMKTMNRRNFLKKWGLGTGGSVASAGGFLAFLHLHQEPLSAPKSERPLAAEIAVQSLFAAEMQVDLLRSRLRYGWYYDVAACNELSRIRGLLRTEILKLRELMERGEGGSAAYRAIARKQMRELQECLRRGEGDGNLSG